MVSYYKNGLLAHAYLIETNNIKKCEKVLLNVIKNIFCNEDYSTNCNKCSLCHLIDSESLPTLKVIEPDGNFIKKEQIIELKNDFSTYSQITDKRIYIIKYCERLNKESANTILKFLEEPSSFIIGFFITNNVNNVFETIQSRCQIIKETFDDNIIDRLGLSNDEYENYYSLITKYLIAIEKDGKKSITNNNEFAELDRKEVINILQIILDIYQNLLHGNKDYFSDHRELEFLLDYNKYNIQKKNELIMELLRKINYNVNVLLLLDDFVLEMDGINNETL